MRRPIKTFITLIICFNSAHRPITVNVVKHVEAVEEIQTVNFQAPGREQFVTTKSFISLLNFWATVCKTVMLSDRCLSVCLTCPVCL